MERNTEELVRIRILKKGRSYRGSVSMDYMLASALAEALGGDEKLQAWAQSVTDAIETASNSMASKTPLGQRVSIKAGLSRLLQREAIRFLLNHKKTIQSDVIHRAGVETPSC